MGYQPTKEAKSKPRLVFVTEKKGDKDVKILVAIGGEVKRKAKLPKRGEVVIPQATSAQLKQLFDRGNYSKLIEEVPAVVSTVKKVK